MKHLTEGTLLQGGRYKITKIAGHGGFGNTYLGVQSMLNRKVAIKEYFPGKWSDRDSRTNMVRSYNGECEKKFVSYRRKFIKEAQTIVSMNHPGVVKIHEMFEENGTAYYVMECLSDTLDSRIKRGGLTYTDAIECFVKMGEALTYIHKRKVLHLDIKPENIMFRSVGDNNSILIDFGLAKHYDEGGNQTTQTPVGISKGYAPVEQYNQKLGNFTPVTDVYSLGATLYTMLTGLVPPEATELISDPLPIEPLKRAGASLEVIRSIQKAMAPAKQNRYFTVAEFVSAVVGNNYETSGNNKNNLRGQFQKSFQSSKKDSSSNEAIIVGVEAAKPNQYKSKKEKLDSSKLDESTRPQPNSKNKSSVANSTSPSSSLTEVYNTKKPFIIKALPYIVGTLFIIPLFGACLHSCFGSDDEEHIKLEPGINSSSTNSITSNTSTSTSAVQTEEPVQWKMELPDDIYMLPKKDAKAFMPNTSANVGLTFDAPKDMLRDNTSIENLYVNKCSIGSHAFLGCSNLKNIYTEGAVDFGFCSFWKCTSLKKVEARTSSIKAHAFQYCTSLEMVKLHQDGNSPITIGDSAFVGCTALKTVLLANDNLSNGANTTKGIIPLGNLMSLSALEDCPALEEVSVTESYFNRTDYRLFGNWQSNNIKKMYLLVSNPKHIDWSGDGRTCRRIDEGFNKKQCILYVPDKLLSEFKKDDCWHGFKAIKPLSESAYYDAEGYFK